MMIPFIVLWLLCAGCGSSNDTEDETNIDEAEIQRIMSLGYVGAAKETVDIDEKGVRFVDVDKTYPGYSLYTIEWLCKSILIDLHGRVVNSWAQVPCTGHWHNAELLPGGRLLVVDGVNSKLCLYAWDGSVIWERLVGSVHHDAEVNWRGDFVFIRFNRLQERIGGLQILDCEVLRVDDDGNISGKLSLFRTIRENEIGFELLLREIKSWGRNDITDLFHANSVECMNRPDLAKRNPIYDLDNVLVSSRHQDCILILNWGRNELVWAWGHGELSGPHDATCLDNGNILVFDNGVKRGWSRVIEVDPIKKKIVWEYRGGEKLYTRGRGSAQRLPNGNTLISISDAGWLLEVTPDGKIVWEFLNPEFTPEGKRWHFARVKRYESGFIEDLLNQEK